MTKLKNLVAGDVLEMGTLISNMDCSDVTLQFVKFQKEGRSYRFFVHIGTVIVGTLSVVEKEGRLKAAWVD